MLHKYPFVFLFCYFCGVYLFYSYMEKAINELYLEEDEEDTGPKHMIKEETNILLFFSLFWPICYLLMALLFLFLYNRHKRQ